MTFNRRRQGPRGLHIHSAVSLLLASRSFSSLSGACSNYEPGDEVSSSSVRLRKEIERALDILIWFLQGKELAKSYWLQLIVVRVHIPHV